MWTGRSSPIWPSVTALHLPRSSMWLGLASRRRQTPEIRPERRRGVLLTAPLALRPQKMHRLRRLAGRRSAREAERVFVAEGIKVVSEALAAGAPVEAVFVDAGTAEVGNGPGGLADLLDRASAAGVRVHTLAPGVLERVASTVTPQPVMALVGYVDVALPALAGGPL